MKIAVAIDFLSSDDRHGATATADQVIAEAVSARTPFDHIRRT